jgi:thiosulfate/3-mercaptopyruvate sulfurtransferase
VPRAEFVARPREGLIASRDDVLRAIEGGGSCVVNALSEEQHRGETTSAYGRSGHIPTSVNVPSGSLVDPSTNAYLPLEQLRARFEAVGATSEPVITYCGGGIAASNDAFVLTLLGVDRVAVYDGSLSEWAADPALPLEVG